MNLGHEKSLPTKEREREIAFSTYDYISINRYKASSIFYIDKVFVCLIC